MFFLFLGLVVGFVQVLFVVLVVGKDFEVMKLLQLVFVLVGKVEVIEFFWYGCLYCYEFELMIEVWVKKQGNNIDFKCVLVVFCDDFVLYLKLYYVVFVFGIFEKVMLVIFNVIYKQKNYLLMLQVQVDFLVMQGVDKKKFMDVYNLFSVQGEVNQLVKLLKDYVIDGVLMVVVQGKYKMGFVYMNSILGIVQVFDFFVKQVQDKKF